MTINDRVESLVLGVVAVMETHHQTLDAHRTRVVHLCPGCDAWQVEAIVDDNGSDPFLARDAAEEHRAECPGLDLLAGLSGTP